MANPPAHEFRFTWNAKLFKGRSGGDDHRLGTMLFLVSEDKPESILRFQLLDFGALKFRSLIRRLPLHVWAQSVPGYAS